MNYCCVVLHATTIEFEVVPIPYLVYRVSYSCLFLFDVLFSMMLPSFIWCIVFCAATKYYVRVFVLVASAMCIWNAITIETTREYKWAIRNIE
jgi:hypothetical protein